MRLGECGSLSFIAEQYVDVWQCRMEWLFEELANERRRQVHAERFARVVAMIGDVLDGRRTNGQMESLAYAWYDTMTKQKYLDELTAI